MRTREMLDVFATPQRATPEPATNAEAEQTTRAREPVTRAVQLLAFMVDGGKECYGVRDIATGLGMPTSSVHRLLRLLQQASMVTHEEQGSYSLAAEFYRLAWKATSGHGLREAAMPHLRRLVAQVDETAMLGMYDSSRDQMMLVASVDSTQQLRYVTELHQWMPLTHGSTGLGIFSFLPEERREQIIATELAGATAEDISLVRKEVEVTRRRGYALYRRHREPATVGISAPVWDATARVVGNVFVAMPADRYQARKEHWFGEPVQVAAARITLAIGGRMDETLPRSSAAWQAYRVVLSQQP
ncbi:IclR family transcriptional regulator [Dactylosporangium sp. CA-233914]|uniref:IclR family transcriptional regulator n=1 Tax=Dactylosporangium sp. CA-233914 TaxID=3239934 RepID=UPI003D8D5110